MDYKHLTRNAQAAIARAAQESAEADHFRATMHRNAALRLEDGTGNVDNFDQQIAAAEATWDAAQEIIDALPTVEPSEVQVGVDDQDDADPVDPTV